MSHGKIREDKTCLNCGHFVKEKFCPNCGQENTENRKPFHYLFTHFVEDFTHYDGQFWGTIKNLLFKPGKLTETYVEGKRQRFVPPVKLYIFISFITFFLFAIFPPYKVYDGVPKSEKSQTEELTLKNEALSQVKNELSKIRSQQSLTPEDSAKIAQLTAIIKDSVSFNNMQMDLDLDKDLGENFVYKTFKTRKAYDSAQEKNPKLWDIIDKPIAHKLFELKENGVKKGDILRNLAETSLHNLPKALFIYLPIFAFFLWIFHNKKKWWYFEHGVFTLHYFSFLLLIILFITTIAKVKVLTNSTLVNGLFFIIMTATVIYSILYFFIAHRRVYHAHGLKSLVIGSVLFTVNFMAFMFLVIVLAVVSFLMIH